MTDQALGTTVLLPDEEASLSKQIINDFFTLQATRDNEPERSISDDEELTNVPGVLRNYEPERSISDDEELTNVPGVLRNYEPEGTTTAFWGRMKGMVQEFVTWESALVAFVVLLVLAHLWNLVELSLLQ